MKRALRLLWKIYETACVALVTLAGLGALFLVVLWFSDSFALPNGMIVRRAFAYPEWYGVSHLYAADGRTRLAARIGRMCFDDRYVKVYAGDDLRAFDGKTGEAVLLSDKRLGGLRDGLHPCNGYYTDWIEADFLYRRTREAIVPPCKWRNLDNASLKNLAWLKKRRCGPQDWHGG